MADDVPTAEDAVPSFLHALMWASIFACVDAVIAGKPVLVRVGALTLSLCCHIVGVNWPKLKTKVGPRFALSVYQVANLQYLRPILTMVFLGFWLHLLQASMRLAGPDFVMHLHQRLHGWLGFVVMP